MSNGKTISMQSLTSMARTGRGSAGISLPRIYPRQIGLAILFVMTTQAFQFFPGMSMPNELWNVLCFLFLCFIYLAWKARSGDRFLGVEFYILGVMCVIPLWSGFAAQYIFGQPAFYGILSQRDIILATGALALLIFHRVGWVDSADCKSAFLILAWATLILYSVWSALGLALGSSSSAGGAGSAVVKFNFVFVQIGFFYYGLIGFNRKSYIHYILAAPFLLFIVSTGQRAQLLCTIGAYGLFILIRGSFARLIVFVPSALIGFVALIGALYLVNPTFVTALSTRTADALTAVATGQQTQDASANSRLQETAVALPYIASSPLLGNGDISNQYNGGYPGVLNAYFFPADVGIVGVLYKFGMLGLIFFAFQFWWMWKYARAATLDTENRPIIDAIKAFLVVYAVISLESGIYANKFPTGALMIAFLYITVVERQGLGKSPRSHKHLHSAMDIRGLQRPL